MQLSYAARPLQPAKLSGTRLRAILFHFSARVCVQGAPDAHLRSRVTFFEDFPLLGLSFRTSRFRGHAAPWPAIPGQVALGAEELFYFPKALNGAAGYQHLEREGERRGVEYVFYEQFFYRTSFTLLR